MARIAVVGGANIDIGGFSQNPILDADSNPGRVRISLGGVGRNIACNAARLGLDVRLMTMLGTDPFADLIRRDCAKNGIDLDHAIVEQGSASSIYLFIADSNGDMVQAVNDMALHERMRPDIAMQHISMLNTMDAVVLDANLPGDTLTALARSVRVPLIADAVSAAKVDRLLGALPYLTVLKPNHMEAEKLTGIPVRDPSSAKAASLSILDMGVRRVFITLGARGACCAENGRAVFLAGRELPMVNATGAGDAFTAALAWAETRGADLTSAAIAGMAAASLAIESAETVNPDMSSALLQQRIRWITETTKGE